MLLIIDGHNLIPKVEGLSLEDPDDERRLVELLQQYARLKRREVLVFFDKAAPGRAGERSFGLVKAHFVPASSKADDAIAQKLKGMPKRDRQQARVVTSDRMVQAEARENGVAVIESPAFARELLSTLASARPEGPAAAQSPEPSANLDEWYQLFDIDPRQAEQPLEPEKQRPRGQRALEQRALKQRSLKQRPPGPQVPGKGGGGASQPSPRRRKYHGFDKKPG